MYTACSPSTGIHVSMYWRGTRYEWIQCQSQRDGTVPTSGVSVLSTYLLTLPRSMVPYYGPCTTVVFTLQCRGLERRRTYTWRVWWRCSIHTQHEEYETKARRRSSIRLDSTTHTLTPNGVVVIQWRECRYYMYHACSIYAYALGLIATLPGTVSATWISYQM